VKEGDTNTDMSCVNAPMNVTTGKPILTCPARMKYCTIVRNDIKTTGLYVPKKKQSINMLDYANFIYNFTPPEGVLKL